jgi:primase-polymerase (primpol)-like protein
MAETAGILALAETENQFDKVTVNRNIKELKNLSTQFSKAATEAQASKQRLTGLYEDMGVILNRYFDIQELAENLDAADDEEDIVPKNNKDVINTIKKVDAKNTKKLATAAAVMQQGDDNKSSRPKISDVNNIARKIKAIK